MSSPVPADPDQPHVPDAPHLPDAAHLPEAPHAPDQPARSSHRPLLTHVPHRGERRWPMAAAVISASVLHSFLPDGMRPAERWVIPTFTVVLLGVLIAGDPGRIDKPKRWLSIVTGILVGLLTLVNAVSAVELVAAILDNVPFTNASVLLLYGGIVYVCNIIAFALWFWTLDGGGPAARAAGTGTRPAFIFPEMNFTRIVGDGWYPKFVDYFAFAFATATAFSPTDVSAVRPWSKLLLVSEAALSLALAALVIARAINVLQ